MYDASGLESLLAVAEECAGKFGETVESLSTRAQTPRLARIRALIAREMRDRCSASLADIGGVFNRDHTTILIALRKYAPDEPRPALGV
jgi:chromosomal replication initiation ATPase DnaA